MTSSQIKLVVKGTLTSFARNNTHELWQRFGPMIKSIPNKTDNDKYSVQVYPNANFFKNFDPTKTFKKYAAVKVSHYENLPEGLEKLIIPEGQYAVFEYIGKPSQASKTFHYILGQWLPNSKYTLDERPHFCKMGEKYKGEQSSSEEELFIPISYSFLKL